jgi:hypothetical protein
MQKFETFAENTIMVRLASLALFIVFTAILASGCQGSSNNQNQNTEAAVDAPFHAHYGTPLLDGQAAAGEVWAEAEWLPLDQVWIGRAPDAADCSGRYKLAWDENNLYVLAEITDDTLIDIHADPLLRYWDDDCLEVFVDEDASGGNHQYNYNAFAYHIALDGRVADVAPDSSFRLYDDHVISRRTSQGNVHTWEVAIKLFDDGYSDDGENVPKLLRAGKVIGFALAYCDNDRSAERENFLGSIAVEGEDKNQGWINASIFGKTELQQ